ncbi:MAG: WbqC family protein [Thermodesulfobacteriota bacterium]
MIIAIHQPQFMPWLGYFDKIDLADAFVYLDNVQFKKNEYQNRNRIKTSQGWQWLTVPVTYRYPEKICEVKIDNKANWKKKHLMSIKTNYKKTPYFDLYFQEIVGLYSKNYEYLSDFNIASVEMISRLLGLDKKTHKASGIKGLREEPTLRLVDICKSLCGDTYLSGRDGKEYMDISAFTREGIEVVFQEFNHPIYPQLYGDFNPFMSSIDMLFNCGKESLKVLRA